MFIIFLRSLQNLEKSLLSDSRIFSNLLLLCSCKILQNLAESCRILQNLAESCRILLTYLTFLFYMNISFSHILRSSDQCQYPSLISRKSEWQPWDGGMSKWVTFRMIFSPFVAEIRHLQIFPCKKVKGKNLHLIGYAVQ